ncbi:Hypothetical_protein [Hexamita inflata]|uniref:Hypothetical_protein n=1 Tax=Hexamita inflata TaxID=28002 RepID=A0AA86QJD8_9EUKA|nr:Hypothetical protein HINF_LOCUS40420 [Hexamita inflata]
MQLLSPRATQRFISNVRQGFLTFFALKQTLKARYTYIYFVGNKASSLPGFLAGRAEISWQEEDSRRFGILNLANCQKAMNKFIKPGQLPDKYVYIRYIRHQGRYFSTHSSASITLRYLFFCVYQLIYQLTVVISTSIIIKQQNLYNICIIIKQQNLTSCDRKILKIWQFARIQKQLARIQQKLPVWQP